MKRYLSQAGAASKLILLIGILMLVPLCVLPFYPEESVYAPAFLITAGLSILTGLIAGGINQIRNEKEENNYSIRKSSVTVLAAWGFGFLSGAVPFVLGRQLNVVQALFESVSGWTTTGLSAMDVAAVPHIYLFYRSFMQFCGGLGFVLMMIVFVEEKESMKLYNAEGHPDKLMPSLKKTARIITAMYLAFLAGGTLLYRICGVNFFEGINHAMCALSTGGFSTRPDSIGAFGSFPVELVTVVLMLIGTTNFAVLLLLARKKIRQILKVSEERFLVVLLLSFVPLMAVALMAGLGQSLGASFQNALFNAVSALSTSGFSTMSYADWPQSTVGIMILLMLIGGGIGSTAGGIKLTRVYLAVKVCAENIKSRLSSQRRVTSPFYRTAHGKQLIDSQLFTQTAVYILTYLSIFCTGAFLLTITAGCSLGEAMFEFASALGTVGLSIGLTGPATGSAALLVEIAGMILGRLEIFIVFIGICSLFHSGRNFFFKRKRL